MAPRTAPVPPTDAEIDAVLEASRGLVHIAARSIAPVEDVVTLPQYRLLLRLRSQPRAGVHLAEDLGVAPSTIVRMVDRLDAKGLCRRTRAGADRRVTLIELTDEGRALIDGVTERRRADLRDALARLTARQRTSVVTALSLVAHDGGEPAAWPF